MRPAPTNHGWPTVRVAGCATDRGREYGRQASRLVQRSLACYEEIFGHYAALTWHEARAAALRFIDPIARFDPTWVAEVEGIAAGAGVDFEDILALNVRTELMFGIGHPPGECTALAALPAVAGGRTIVAQNWDWKPCAADSLLLLVMAPLDGPGFVSLVEAGLLAKCGVNSHGVAVVTNALVSHRDRGSAGVPYHVLLRGVLASSTASEAVRLVAGADRASSANYLIAHREQGAINLECEPGACDSAYRLGPESGLLIHANHFMSAEYRGIDRHLGRWQHSESDFRQRRATQLLRSTAGLKAVDGDVIRRVLTDHANFPDSICCHRREHEPAVAAYESIAALIIDLTAQQILVTAGPPCTAPDTVLDVAQLLDHVDTPTSSGES